MFKSVLMVMVFSMSVMAGEPKSGNALFGTAPTDKGLLLVDGQAAQEIYGFLSVPEEKEEGLSAKEAQGIRCILETAAQKYTCSVLLNPKGVN